MSDTRLSGLQSRCVGRAVFFSGGSWREIISESPANQFWGWLLLGQEALTVSEKAKIMNRRNFSDEFYLKFLKNNQ